jgi:hypothetical protein
LATSTGDSKISHGCTEGSYSGIWQPLQETAKFPMAVNRVNFAVALFSQGQFFKF